MIFHLCALGGYRLISSKKDKVLKLKLPCKSFFTLSGQRYQISESGLTKAQVMCGCTAEDEEVLLGLGVLCECRTFEVEVFGPVDILGD